MTILYTRQFITSAVVCVGSES